MTESAKPSRTCQRCGIERAADEFWYRLEAGAEVWHHLGDSAAPVDVSAVCLSCGVHELEFTLELRERQLQRYHSAVVRVIEQLWLQMVQGDYHALCEARELLAFALAMADGREKGREGLAKGIFDDIRDTLTQLRKQGKL